MFEHLRIGLTMRQSDACDYHESRDGLASSWYDFLSAALPGSSWVALPNTGKSIVRAAESFGLNGLILTGGESRGVYPQRDESEMALISYALQKKIPVIGICRGLQMLHSYFGGELITCDRNEHVAVRHAVFFQGTSFCDAGRQEVNSYHGNAIELQGLPGPLLPFALDYSGMVEGVFSNEFCLAGIMWHPEREAVFADSDIFIFNKLFS